MNRIFIGNIPYTCAEEELKEWIQAHGYSVETIEFPYDRATSRPRGFGFATLQSGTDVNEAIAVMNGQRLRDRVLTVNEATPRRFARTA